MSAKVQVIFYSVHGHVYRLAEAIARFQGKHATQLAAKLVAGKE